MFFIHFQFVRYHGSYCSRYQKFLKYYLFSNETNTNINTDFATFCGRLRNGLLFCGLDPNEVEDVFPHLQSFTMAAEEMIETTSMMQQIKELHESMEQVHIKNEIETQSSFIIRIHL